MTPLVLASGEWASDVLSQLARKLMAFFHGRRSALVDISGEIDKMHAALRLLARLDPHDGSAISPRSALRKVSLP